MPFLRDFLVLHFNFIQNDKISCTEIRQFCISIVYRVFYFTELPWYFKTRYLYLQNCSRLFSMGHQYKHHYEFTFELIVRNLDRSKVWMLYYRSKVWMLYYRSKVWMLYLKGMKVILHIWWMNVTLQDSFKVFVIRSSFTWIKFSNCIYIYTTFMKLKLQDVF